MLKSYAVIMLPNFDRSWFEDRIVSSKNSLRLLLLGGQYANKILDFLFLIAISPKMLSVFLVS